MSYKKNPPLIDAAIVEKARALGTALLADGMKGMIEMDGCMDVAVMPIGLGMKMAGTALTVETENGDNFPIHVATYSGGEGYIMVIDGKNCADRPYFGELICSAAKAVGYSGMVVDGLVRDRAEVIALEFPVFAKGFLQRGPLKKGPGNINTPIRCAGLTVNPGDLIVGDDDGVTVVPRDMIDEVIQKAEEKASYETNRKLTIKQYAHAKATDGPLPELAPQWVLDMLK